MKNLLLLILTIFTLTSCDKDDDKPKTELEKLPPATQTGARTFGCLLDGVAFVPTKSNCSSFYQYVNGYYFSLQGNKYVNKELILLGLSTDNLKIEEGKTYILLDKIDGNASAAYFDDIDNSRTSLMENGEMKITKLDLTKNIVSGTFWYDIKDGKGIVHKIREGRFDMPFTQ
nr:hypothetical protein [uncultured Flavobacterium sp.]